MNPKIKATVKTKNGVHDIEMPLKQNDFDKALDPFPKTKQFQ